MHGGVNIDVSSAEGGMVGASISGPGREAPARGTPMRVALAAHTTQEDATLECLLADAAEATAVYAQLAGVECPELVRARCGRDLAGCSAVLLALRLGERGRATEGTPLAYAEPGAGVYAIISVDEEPGIAAYAVAELEDACDARGLVWRGCVVVGDAALLPRVARQPRMGWARRRVSEAVDGLLLALLAKTDAGEKYVRPSLYARLIGALSRP